jgi:hypothetical protein
MPVKFNAKHQDDEYDPGYGMMETTSDEEEGVLFEHDEEVEEGMDDNALVALRCQASKETRMICQTGCCSTRTSAGRFSP